MPFVTLIIPIYNAERYLRRCLDLSLIHISSSQRGYNLYKQTHLKIYTTGGDHHEK